MIIEHKNIKISNEEGDKKSVAIQFSHSTTVFLSIADFHILCDALQVMKKDTPL